jgi:hypothetical protein
LHPAARQGAGDARGLKSRSRNSWAAAGGTVARSTIFIKLADTSARERG